MPSHLRAKVARDTEKYAAMARKAWAKTPDATLPVIKENGRKLSPSEVRQRLNANDEPLAGEWPDEGVVNELLDLTRNFRTNALPERMHIALIPTSDWTEIPAYLNWGGWNGCPPPEYHVAAFRAWRDRYGARLVTMTGDCVEMQVAQRPATREAALTLAREQYDYDTEVIDQTFAPLAASLMVTSVWSFWWD